MLCYITSTNIININDLGVSNLKFNTNNLSPNGSLIFSIITAVIISVIINVPIYAQSGRLICTPPTSAQSNLPIPIEATIEGANVLPVEARIYYRSAGEIAYSNVEMRRDRHRLFGEIPASDVKQADIEFYLWVELEGNLVITLPEGAPNRADPFTIPVRETTSEVESSGEAVVILSPEPGELCGEGKVLIAISLLQAVRRLDPANIRITLDGKDLTKSANVSEELITVMLPSVRPGEHTVKVFYVQDGKSEKLVGWVFHRPLQGLPERSESPIRADVSAGYSYEDVSEVVRRVSFVDGRVIGKVGKLEGFGRIYISSLERGNAQPQNRFLGSLKYGGLKVSAGDVTPYFSEFSIWGTRLRGFEVNLRTFAFNLDFAQGERRRAVEGIGFYTNDTTYVIGVNGDTLRSLVNPNEDSIRVRYNVKRITSTGTYRRNITAIRPGFPLTDNLTLSFSVLKAKDEVESIEFGRAPKDNLLFGADLAYQSTNRRVFFNSETMVSMYNDDISEGAMEDAKQIEDFIVVNQFFDPMPTDSVVLEEDVDPVKLAGSLWSELLKSSLAHRTDLTINYFHNELKIGYKSIGRSFRSLGSSAILTDISGLSVQDRLRLFRNRIYLTVGYEAYQDNVNGRAQTTTDRNIIRSSVSIYSPPGYPNLNLGFRTAGRKNNGELITTVMPDGSQITNDTRVDNVQNTYNFSIDQTFNLRGWTHSTTLSYSNVLMDDNISDLQNSKQSTISLSLMSVRQLLWEFKGSFSLSNQDVGAGRNGLDYKSVFFNARYTFLPNRVWFNGGFNGTFTEGGQNNVNPPPPSTQDSSTTIRNLKIDFSRLEFSLGVEYVPHTKHLINLSASKALHTDNSYTEYYSGVRSFNKDNPSFKDQDDTVVRLTYTYKM